MTEQVKQHSNQHSKQQHSNQQRSKQQHSNQQRSKQQQSKSHSKQQQSKSHSNYQHPALPRRTNIQTVKKKKNKDKQYILIFIICLIAFGLFYRFNYHLFRNNTSDSKSSDNGDNNGDNNEDNNGDNNGDDDNGDDNGDDDNGDTITPSSKKLLKVAAPKIENVKKSKLDTNKLSNVLSKTLSTVENTSSVKDERQKRK